MSGGGAPRVIVILGPTATGKTALALALAPPLGAEVISADSAMVYRGMDVGTAKPSPAEQARVPHHLIDVIDPDQRFSVAEFQSRARALIRRLWARGRVPMVVGGTGLYIRALTEDYPLAAVPAPPDPALRRQLEAWARQEGPEAVHRLLAARDPDAAARIHPRDLRRTIRALEVLSRTGEPPPRTAGATEGQGGGARYLKVGLSCPRPVLYARIHRRTEEQVAAGLVEETRRLLARYGPDAPGLQVLGYRQLVEHLLGRCSLAEAVARIQRDTRHLAKRQITWFRREPNVRWVNVHGYRVEELAALLLPWLEGFVQGKVE